MTPFRLCAAVWLAIAGAAYAQPALGPFSFYEGFEEKDPVQFWVSNGHSDVAFKGLTDEAAFEGKRCFKLDVTIQDGSYHYWRIPLNVPCEGKLKLSARLRVGEGTTAGVGVNFAFPPTSHSGCGAFETVNEPTGVEPHVVKCWYQAGRQIYDKGQRLLVPELLLKDDRLVRVDMEKNENWLRSTAPDGTETYLPCSGPTSEQLKMVRPVEAKTLQPVDVPAQSAKQFWLTMHVPADAQPGTHRGAVKLQAEGRREVELPLTLTVYPFALAASPVTYSIYYRGVLTPDGRGSISSEAKSEQQYAADMRDLAAHGVLYPTLYQELDKDLLPKALGLRRQAGLPSGALYSPGVGLGNTTDPNQLRELQQRIKRWQEAIAPFAMPTRRWATRSRKRIAATSAWRSGGRSLMGPWTTPISTPSGTSGTTSTTRPTATTCSPTRRWTGSWTPWSGRASARRWTTCGM